MSSSLFKIHRSVIRIWKQLKHYFSSQFVLGHEQEPYLTLKLQDFIKDLIKQLLL